MRQIYYTDNYTTWKKSSDAYQCIWNSKCHSCMVWCNVSMITKMASWIAGTHSHWYGNNTEKRKRNDVSVLSYIRQSVSVMNTYITAASMLSTAQNANKKIPGPRRPRIVISLRTERTVHRRKIRVSAKWPDTTENKSVLCVSWY